MYVGYIRVSDVGDRDPDGDRFRSVKDQTAAIEAWALKTGHAVDILQPELDESGGRADRPIFMEAVDGIKAGTYEGIVAHEQSRLHRETIHLLVMVDAVHAAGGEVAVTEGNVDWRSPDGRAFGTIKGAFDEFYRLDKARKFEHYRKSSVERGIWKFRQTPLGYDRDEETRRLVPNADAPIVIRAFAARKAGAGMTEIAEILNMTPSGARALLRNRVYLGEIIGGPYVKAGCHEPLIDVATFEAVQAMRQTRPARGKLPIALLAGLARCVGCGHVMSLNRNGKYGGTYGCRGRRSEGACPSPGGITAPLVEAYVVELARAELERLRIRTTRNSKDLSKLRDDVAKAESELAAFLTATRAAGLPLESYVQSARERQDDVDAAKRAVEQHHTLSPLGGTFETGAELWDDLNGKERNQLLRGLVDAVVIRPVGRGNVVPVADRVRVFQHGSLAGEIIHQATGAGKVLPIRALPFPDLDDERLLGVTSFEDGLRGAGS